MTGASARIRVRVGAIAASEDVVRARGWVGRSRRAKGHTRARAAGRRLGAGLRRLGANVRRAGVVHGENEPHGDARRPIGHRRGCPIGHRRGCERADCGIFATAEGGFLFYFEK